MVLMALAMGMLSLVEIKASRPYKALKRAPDTVDAPEATVLEAILKSLSFAVVALAAAMVAARAWG